MDYCIGFSATLPGYEMDRIKAQQDAINQLNSQSNFSELFLESLRIYKTAATKKGLSSSFFSCGCSHRRSYLSCYLVTTTTTTKLAPSHALLIGRQPSWLENTPTKSKSASAWPFWPSWLRPRQMGFTRTTPIGARSGIWSSLIPWHLKRGILVFSGSPTWPLERFSPSSPLLYNLFPFNCYFLLLILLL